MSGLKGLGKKNHRFRLITWFECFGINQNISVSFRCFFLFGRGLSSKKHGMNSERRPKLYPVETKQNEESAEQPVVGGWRTVSLIKPLECMHKMI